MKQSIFLYAFLMLSLLIGEVFADTHIVNDPDFEARLSENKIYQTVPGDTLRKLGYKLYSHKSWYHRIIQQNPAVANFGADEKLPVGVKVSYIGERIDYRYRVQSRDILYRIVTWKWGSFENWISENSERIKQVRELRRIEIGDTLIFDDNRNITHIPTSKLPELAESDEWKFYETNEQDTLRLIAFRVYASKSKWKQLVIHNKIRGRVNPYRKVGAGKRLVYIGPKIEGHFKIRKRDSLSRVALWKYGDTGRWKEIYDMNREKIQDPNLIYPGDFLVFEGKTFEHMKPAETTEPVVADTPVEEPVAEPEPEFITEPEPEPMMKKVVVETVPAPSRSVSSNQSNYKPFILAGLVLLLGVLGFYYWKEQQEGAGDIDPEMVARGKIEQYQLDMSEDPEILTKVFEENKSSLMNHHGKAYEHGRYPKFLKKLSHKIQAIIKR
jgi:phage tail protein X